MSEWPEPGAGLAGPLAAPLGRLGLRPAAGGRPGAPAAARGVRSPRGRACWAAEGRWAPLLPARLGPARRSVLDEVRALWEAKLVATGVIGEPSNEGQQ